MSRAMKTARTHAIAEWGLRGGAAKTFCGRQGWRSRSSDNEFETDLGARFEISERPSCAVCKRAASANEARNA